jgi:hypothetical protein
MAVSANDGEIGQCSFLSFLPGVCQRSSVMDMGIPIAEFAVSREEIEPAPGNLTHEPATIQTERLVDLCSSQFSFTTAVDDEALVLLSIPSFHPRISLNSEVRR